MTSRSDFSSAVVDTFARRAVQYDGESVWMRDSRALQPLAPEPFGNRVALDLAAGTGLVGAVLAERGWSVVHLDISAEMLRSAGGSRVVGDSQFLPIRESSVDLIVCRQALHYFLLPAVAREIRRVGAAEIRLGQIVAPNEVAAKWWNELFQVLAPGRRRVFLPGEVEDFARSVAAGWTASTERFALRDDFRSNFAHLEEPSRQVADSIVSSMPAEVSAAIDFRDGTYRQDWEIVKAGRK